MRKMRQERLEKQQQLEAQQKQAEEEEKKRQAAIQQKQQLATKHENNRYGSNMDQKVGESVKRAASGLDDEELSQGARILQNSQLSEITNDQSIRPFHYAAGV